CVSPSRPRVPADDWGHARASPHGAACRGAFAGGPIREIVPGTAQEVRAGRNRSCSRIRRFWVSVLEGSREYGGRSLRVLHTARMDDPTIGPVRITSVTAAGLAKISSEDLNG